MKILLVDDSPPVLKLLEATLARIGYADVHSAQSGQEALDFLGFGSEDGLVPVDLVLLDIVMPEPDGIEVCRRIKLEKRYEDTPVIMVTVKDEPEVLKEAFDKGASDYIIKPVRELEIMARVGAALRLKKEIEKRKRREQQLEELTEELKIKNVQLVKQVNTDELTNIGNRHFFMNDMEKEWRRAIRESVPFSLLLIDIDFFREFEEKYGKKKGIECLKLAANIFQIALKRAGDQVARIDGAQFAVYLPHTDDQGAQAVAEAMRANIEALRIKNNGSQNHEFVTVSIGGASLVPSIDLQIDRIFGYAEKALLAAKNQGYNQVQCFFV